MKVGWKSYFFQIIKSHVWTHLSLIGTIFTSNKFSFIIWEISSVERLYCWILNFTWFADHSNSLLWKKCHIKICHSFESIRYVSLKKFSISWICSRVKKQKAKSKESSSNGNFHSKSTIFFFAIFGYFSNIFSEISQIMKECFFNIDIVPMSDKWVHTGDLIIWKK